MMGFAVGKMRKSLRRQTTSRCQSEDYWWYVRGLILLAILPGLFACGDDAQGDRQVGKT
jgi:hypothetical protein